MRVAVPLPSERQASARDQHNVGPLKPLLLRPRDAARVLAISERLLWSMTAPRGPIACVRFGRRVLYPVADLDVLIGSLKEESRP
jgi:hypothetical protein